MSTSKNTEAKLGEIKSAEIKSAQTSELNEDTEAARPSIIAALSSTLNRLGQHYKAVISLVIIQLIMAIIGIAWPCNIGFYTVSINKVYNTFWIAIPVSP